MGPERTITPWYDNKTKHKNIRENSNENKPLSDCELYRLDIIEIPETITLEEVALAALKLKNNTASGPDYLQKE